MRYIVLTVLLLFSGCSNTDEDKLAIKVTTNSKDINQSDGNKTKEEIDSTLETPIIDVDVEIIDGDKIGIDEVMMELNKIYKVRKGDSIQEIDNARVRIIKNSEKDFSEVILISGNARLIRGAKNWF